VIAVLFLFSLWLWALPLAIIVGILLLPKSVDLLVTSRVASVTGRFGSVAFMVFLALCTSLLIVWTWSPADGAIFLFAASAWWSTVTFFPGRRGPA
jgi:hypothetical protein